MNGNNNNDNRSKVEEKIFTGLVCDNLNQIDSRTLLMDAVLSNELSGEIFPTKVPTDDENFRFPSITENAGLVAIRPGSKIRLKNTSYKLIIVQYEFRGQHGGHGIGHDTEFKNISDSEVRLNAWDEKIVTVGQAGGLLVQRSVYYSSDGRVESNIKFYEVKIDSLVYLGTHPTYKLIGNTDNHSLNHYVTYGTRTALRDIARTYNERTGGGLLNFNDASLEWGGIFDIKGDYTGPHHEHRDGTSIDIAATPTTLTNEPLFLEILRGWTTNYILEGEGNSRHYHVRF